MADRRRRVKVGPFHVRIASGKLFIPGDVASRIENMWPTEEGTLRSVAGPVPYVPAESGASAGGAPASGATPNTTPGNFAYGNIMRGIFHCQLSDGEQEVLLLHTSNQIWTFQGWGQRNGLITAWDRLIPTTLLPNDNTPRFPTQFVATPTGVVIVPQSSRAYFYDGEIALPLGYSKRPAPPAPKGVRSVASTGLPSKGDEAASAGGWVNNDGYAHDALPGMDSQINPTFRWGRIGTTIQSGSSTNWVKTLGTGSNPKDSGAGWLEPGSWRYAVQFVDRWGNLSPLSGESEEVRFERQASFWFDSSTTEYGPTMVDKVRKQLACASVPVGPVGTIGRILYRTKDLINSGSTDLYEVPLNAAVSANSFATLPDNVTTIYPDNIPDFWLAFTPQKPVPVGEFKLAALAFGSLWAANFKGAPGLVRPSMVGRWGTFLENQEIYPDPEGGEITGLLTVPNALLVFTETSAYRIEPYYDGPGFRSMSLSQSVGCVAPSSCAILADGRAIWLARDGFYTYNGTEVKHVSSDLDVPWKRHNHARMMQAAAAVDSRTELYRCWLPIDGSRENNRCYEYDGVGWRIRSDVSAAAVCTTKDHRGYMLVAGKHDTNYGVWLLDHQVQSYQPSATTSRVSRVDTAWLSSSTSQTRKTACQVELWLMEYGSSDITVEVRRDWRKKVVETHSVPKNPTDDPPPFWGTATYDAASTEWKKRRPYWRRVQIYVPSAEVFKLTIKGTGRWEFVGFQFDEVPHHTGGSRTPP